jgi:hypothetical protein
MASSQRRRAGEGKDSSRRRVTGGVNGTCGFSTVETAAAIMLGFFNGSLPGTVWSDVSS